jgi:hypothetical protein
MWNGRTDSGRVVAPGIYTVYASARNELGRVLLQRKLRVVAE